MKINKISIKKEYGLKVFTDGKMISFEDGLTFNQALKKMESSIAVCDMLCGSSCINEYKVSLFRYAENDTSNA